MRDAFSPSYKNFQADIEAYLTSQGLRERNSDGQLVFRGYDKALDLLFLQYMTQKAFGPLVAHFRNWNWERSYDDRLLQLTEALRELGDWALLRPLWFSVIAKRRKMYNDLLKFDKRTPGKLPADSLQSARERLLETAERVRGYDDELGARSDVAACDTIIAKVTAGRSA